MPTRAKTICCQPGCNATTDDRYCVAHKRDNTRADYRRDLDKQRADDPYRKMRSGAQWRRTREFILARDPICRDCRREASTDVDHIIMAIMWCGTGENDYYDERNLQGLCKSCHSRKTARETRFAMKQGTL